ncbi:glycerol dehydrogenase [uncultured Sphaerochaeta sp.]|uniref:glycerol dehydrogenase n=1 Tax=uncultured Sphaerochaeta sp. TaxID=886478 RepID=UPI002A0A4EC2|nr:glycerol dehydrogenase [uncultured Sphaerochaeta sp.]
MARIIGSPSRYIQQCGAFTQLAAFTAPLGKKLLILISANGKNRVGQAIEESTKDTDTSITWVTFNGECSKAEIARIQAIVKEKGSQVIVGIGGGKILDTAKAVAHYETLPVVIAPTAASTDAPCSALSVLYTEEGVFEEYLFLPSNPNIVFMDSDVIAAAPARLLISGMGDALATYFEARACNAANAKNCFGGNVSITAMALARLCYDTLLADGPKAVIAMQNHICTPAVENIIEANTYLSGVGFESGGLAAAHAIHNGFTAIEETHKMYHGEKVAFGTIAQLVLENVPTKELEEVIGFCLEVGLPVCLEDLGIKEIKKEQLMEVATLACSVNDTLHNMPFPVSPKTVYAAIMAADAFGHYYKDECDCECDC